MRCFQSPMAVDTVHFEKVPMCTAIRFGRTALRDSVDSTSRVKDKSGTFLRNHHQRSASIFHWHLPENRLCYSNSVSVDGGAAIHCKQCLFTLPSPVTTASPVFSRLIVRIAIRVLINAVVHDKLFKSGRGCHHGATLLLLSTSSHTTHTPGYTSDRLDQSCLIQPRIQLRPRRQAGT